jgi:flavin-dependent dehydrogenase
MSRARPITIVGGGLAGLTLGIGLRQREIPVTIWEASHYPRHRVCGEFVSGRGQEVLERIGLLEMFGRAGAISSSTTRFFLDGFSSPLRAIRPPALCLSRFSMDEMLAKHFCALGGELHQNARYESPHGGEGYVFASGRVAKPTVNGWRWFGLKVHARNVVLEADLEMHTAFNGYVGLCRLHAGEVNICGLFRARPGAPGPVPEQLLAGIPGTLLNQRLASAQYDHSSFCSVAGLCLPGQSALPGSDCRLGDALTMIPPVTGNGMSMAFEAAGIAMPFFDAYCRGQMHWESARQSVAQGCDAAFRQRLFWAKWIHLFMLHPYSRRTIGPLLLNCDTLWDHFFSRTR